MKKFQKINLIIFLCVSFAASSLFYISERVNQQAIFEKPWHLQPIVHEDSLSKEYKSLYEILGKQRVYQQIKDSVKTRVIILVDAWGVPVQEDLLAEDYSYFNDVPHIFALHQRLANRTKHAEHVEFRNDIPGNVYLFGGDSLEYNRPEYVKEIGFFQTVFCQYCDDSTMIGKIDSVLSQDSLKFIAWTAQSSRSGDRDSLRNSLRLIANFAKRHPEVNVIVQGTHRPVLGSPKIRNSYKAHWVPVAILNNRGR